MIGEILTWVGVALASVVCFGLYRAAESANGRESDEGIGGDD